MLLDLQQHLTQLLPYYLALHLTHHQMWFWSLAMLLLQLCLHSAIHILDVVFILYMMYICHWLIDQLTDLLIDGTDGLMTLVNTMLRV